MGLLSATRSSDSSWISAVWSSRSENVSEMTSIASETWGLVFWEHRGMTFAGVAGPESRAGFAAVPEDATFLGIQFVVGTSLRMSSMTELVDGGISLPDTTNRRFWLDGARWQIPAIDDAELLVARLVRAGAIAQDPMVSAVLRGEPVSGGTRTVERHFRSATGLSRGVVSQIERARAAAVSLASGKTVADVVEAFGYYDESHLARALRRFVGRTVGQLRNGTGGAISADLSANDLVHSF